MNGVGTIETRLEPWKVAMHWPGWVGPTKIKGDVKQLMAPWHHGDVVLVGPNGCPDFSIQRVTIEFVLEDLKFWVEIPEELWTTNSPCIIQTLNLSYSIIYQSPPERGECNCCALSTSQESLWSCWQMSEHPAEGDVLNKKSCRKLIKFWGCVNNAH